MLGCRVRTVLSHTPSGTGGVFGYIDCTAVGIGSARGGGGKFDTSDSGHIKST